MAPATDFQTATIIPFPVGGLQARRNQRMRQEVAADAQSGRYSDLAFGGGWYHDEAINEPTDSSGKHI